MRVEFLVWRMVVTSCVVAAVAGCSSFEAPQITVGSPRLTDRSSEAARFDIDLGLENPNDDEIELRQFTYTFAIDGRKAFQGRRAAELTLGGRRQQQTTLPVIVPADHLGAGGSAKWAIHGQLLYITPGEIAELLLDSGVRRPKVAFAARGEVELPAPQ